MPSGTTVLICLVHVVHTFFWWEGVGGHGERGISYSGSKVTMACVLIVQWFRFPEFL